MALNVIHGVAKVWSLSDQQRTTCAVGLEIAPELTGHGLPLTKCEAYNRVYDQPYGSN